MSPAQMDLARRLVEARAFRWEAGMLVLLDGLRHEGRMLYIESRDTGPHLWVAVHVEVTVESSPGPNYTRVQLRSWGPSKERVPRAWPARQCIPDLTDPATAACLAVQAMERGGRHLLPPRSRTVGGHDARRWGVPWRPRRGRCQRAAGDDGR